MYEGVDSEFQPYEKRYGNGRVRIVISPTQEIDLSFEEYEVLKDLLFPWHESIPDPEMLYYDVSDLKFIEIKKIIVDSESDKEQLLIESKYLHDNPLIDTNTVTVNTLVYLHETLNIIEVHK